MSALSLPSGKLVRKVGFYVGMIAGAAVVVVGCTAQAMADANNTPHSRYLAAVGFAPGYSSDVLGAGYQACGAMTRGASRDQVVSDAESGGLGGDLYTTVSIVRIVDSAHANLCPEVQR